MTEKKDIKVLLIDSVERVSLPSIGLGLLAACLREWAGVYNVKILQRKFIPDLADKIIAENPDIIGYTAVTPYLHEVVKIAAQVKSSLPGVPQIIGGPHITSLPNTLPKEFNLGVIGEGEKTICELVDIYRRDGKFTSDNLKIINGLIFWDNNRLVKTDACQPLDDIDSLPLPARDLMNIRGYFAEAETIFPTKLYRPSGLMTARGCPYNCIFCQERALSARFRPHSWERTIKEIEELVYQYDVDLIDIMDDHFLANINRFKKIAQEIIVRGLNKKTAFFCYTRADHITNEVCQLLKEMNVKLVFIGFESGSDRILKYLKNDNCSVSTNQKAYDLLRKHGIHVYGSFIFGSPDETMEEMKMTLDFIKRNHMPSVEMQVLTPLPGSGIWQYALGRGLVSNNMDWSRLILRNRGKNVWLGEKVSYDEFLKFYHQELIPVFWHHAQIIHDFEFKDLFQLKLWRRFFKKPKLYLSKIKHTFIFHKNNLKRKVNQGTDYIYQVDRILLRRQVKKHSRFVSGKVLDIGAGGRSRYRQFFSCESYIKMDVEKNNNIDVVGSASDLPFEDSSFDSIVCTEVLGNVFDIFKASREFFRVLKPGGHALITTTFLNHLYDEPNNFWRFTHYALVRLFEEAGFKIELTEQRGGFFSARAQTNVRYLIDRFNLHNKFWARLLNPILKIYSNFMVWLDNRDTGHANRQFAIGWLIIIKKDSG